MWPPPRRWRGFTWSLLFLYACGLVVLGMVSVGGVAPPPAAPSCHLPREYYAIPRPSSLDEAVTGPPVGPEPNAARAYTGRGVHVTLLDSGLDAGFLAASRNAVSCHSVVPGVRCDAVGCAHGTRSASVLAGDICLGRTKPQRCYRGLAPGAQLDVVRVFDTAGVTHQRYILAALRALQAAVVRDPNRGRVLCLCFGREVFRRNGAIAREIRALATAGVVVVVAAGNEGGGLGGILSPGDLPEVLTVGSISRKPLMQPMRKTTPGGDTGNHTGNSRVFRSGMVSAFSSRGPTTTELPLGAGRMKPELVAVGERVCALEAVRMGRNGGEFTTDFHPASKREEITAQTSIRTPNHAVDDGAAFDTAGETWAESWTLVSNRSGTSIAAALVAGAVVLCIEALQRPNLVSHPTPSLLTKINIALIKEILIKTARRLTPPAMKQVREKEGAWYFATRRNLFRSNLSTAPVNAGDALMRTYTDYLHLLQYSMVAQGAGEIQPDRALVLIEARTKRFQREANDATSREVERDCKSAQDHHRHDDDDEHHNDGELSAAERLTLAGWVVFPPRLDVQTNDFCKYGNCQAERADCLYHWPHCEQALYLGAAPKVFNLTLHVAGCANATLLQCNDSNINSKEEKREKMQSKVYNDVSRFKGHFESEALERRGWSYTIDDVVGYKAVDGGFCDPFHRDHGSKEEKRNCYRTFSLNHSILQSLAIPKLDIQVDATRKLHAHTGTVSVMIQAFLPNRSECQDNKNSENRRSPPNSECGDTIVGIRRKQSNSILLNPYVQIDMRGKIMLVYSCSKAPCTLAMKARTPFLTHITIPFVVSIKTKSPSRLRRLIIDTSHLRLNSLDYSSSSSSTFSQGNSFSTVGGDRNFYKAGGGFTRASSASRANPRPFVNHPHANLALLFLFLTRELGFYVDFFSILISQSFSSSSLECKREGEMVWMTDYLSSVGTLLIVHQWLPMLPSVRRLITSAIRSHTNRGGLNVILVTDWMNPPAVTHFFRSSDEHKASKDMNKTSPAFSIFETRQNYAPTSEEVSSDPDFFSKLCSMVVTAEACCGNASEQRSFHSIMPSSPVTRECSTCDCGLKSSRVFSLNRWVKELIHKDMGARDKNQSNPCHNREKCPLIPHTAMIPELSEVDVRPGLWMISLDLRPPFPRGGVQKGFRERREASHALERWRSIGEFRAGGILRLVSNPITPGSAPDKLTEPLQPAAYDLLLCGGYDLWKKSRQPCSKREFSGKEPPPPISSSQGTIGILSFPSFSYSAGEVGFMTDSYCLSASTPKVQRLFTQLLEVYVAHHVDFAELHGEGLYFFNPQNDLIRRLHQSEGVQSTTCLELLKEVFYAVLAKHHGWFSRVLEDNPVGARAGVHPPPCRVAVGMFDHTFLDKKRLDENTQKQDVDEEELSTPNRSHAFLEETFPYEEVELMHHILQSSSSDQMQVGILVNSMLHRSPFVRFTQMSFAGEIPSCDRDVSVERSVGNPREEFSRSSGLSTAREEEEEFLQHLGTPYDDDPAAAVLSSPARNANQGGGVDSCGRLPLTAFLERNPEWGLALKRMAEKAGFSVVGAFLLVIFIAFFVRGGRFCAGMRRRLPSPTPRRVATI